MKPKIFFLILAIAFLLACNAPFNIVIESSSPTGSPATASATPNPTATDMGGGSPSTTANGPSSITAVPIAPSATLTLSPSNTPAPAPSGGPVTAVSPGSANYIDDRSTPSQLIVSYFNAINRKEYLRAYGYWRDPSTSLGDFSNFAAGYSDTASVDLVFGSISGDRAMSQYHYLVPVILKVTSNSGARTNFAACYLLHASVPDVFGAPPFVPMNIDRGSANPSDVHADDAGVLATACNGYPAGSYTVPVAVSPLNIDKGNFLDNRSGAMETVSSLLNALNLKQYVRAYYYFHDPATYPGDYTSYAAGFSNTDTITATFGTVQSEGAAGSLYYKVPIAMKVLTTSSALQTFIGCYTLRLVQPGVQATPPFRPLGIVAGHFTQVSNSTDVNTQLPTACN